MDTMDTVSGLREFLLLSAQGDLLPWTAHAEAVRRYGLTCSEVERTALASGLLPSRYQRNRETISIEQQRVLFDSAVAIIGCGGLGGYVVEQLARLGVGTLVIADPDVFEEHNLNRQILSSHCSLGKPKVEIASERVAEINPSVVVTPVKEAFSRETGAEMLNGVAVVVDALDTIHARLALAEVCDGLGIPLVHGSIAGWYGQLATQFPGEDTLKKLYGLRENGKGVETMLGNPAFMPAVIASMEVAEVCKILLNRGTLVRRRVLHINLLDMEIEDIKL